MRLLLIEDDLQLAQAITHGLSEAGLVVDAFGTVDEGVSAIKTSNFDTIILDLGLPDGDGLHILETLREQKDSTPVLILTARDGLSDRVGGLNAGADDYLLKPFDMEELIARIKALLRRPGGALGLKLKAGNVFFDTVDREITIQGNAITFTSRETDVLEILLRRVNHVVAKSSLEDKIYGFGDPVSTNSVEVAVHRVRKKLQKNHASVTIHTIRGVGYLLEE